MIIPAACHGTCRRQSCVALRGAEDFDVAKAETDGEMNATCRSLCIDGGFWTPPNGFCSAAPWVTDFLNAAFYAFWDPLTGWGIILTWLWSFRIWFPGSNRFSATNPGRTYLALRHERYRPATNVSLRT